MEHSCKVVRRTNVRHGFARAGPDDLEECALGGKVLRVAGLKHVRQKPRPVRSYEAEAGMHTPAPAAEADGCQ
ncbi:hypothetical protein BAU08_21785 [Bordetella bronchialis]|uniref:Uncharacterized protein n=1 Tax=Bordetella bronchialis TaxID=463025 RepID=A0A193G0V2_9BORD|nr:hypothetical protein BAU06_21245 [Bordetella bronchialis]ANN73632.1 hypothetical protein BAU08_21785 [Bordetella bronchialis]